MPSALMRIAMFQLLERRLVGFAWRRNPTAGERHFNAHATPSASACDRAGNDSLACPDIERLNADPAHCRSLTPRQNERPVVVCGQGGHCYLLFLVFKTDANCDIRRVRGSSRARLIGPRRSRLLELLRRRDHDRRTMPAVSRLSFSGCVPSTPADRDIVRYKGSLIWTPVMSCSVGPTTRLILSWASGIGA
jgi:hypothetical protein